MTFLLAAVGILLVARAFRRAARRAEPPRYMEPSPEEIASFIILRAYSSALVRKMSMPYEIGTTTADGEPSIDVEEAIGIMVKSRRQARETSPAVITAFDRMEGGRLMSIRSKLLGAIEDLDGEDRERANRLIGLLGDLVPVDE